MTSKTNKAQSLYRQEAIDAQLHKQHGQVLLLPTKLHKIGLTFVLIFLAILAYFSHTQSIADTIELRGWVDTNKPTLSIKSQESAGVIDKLYVLNDQVVAKGDILARVIRSHGDALGKQGREKLQSEAKKEQNNRLNLIDIQSTTLHKEIKQLESTLSSFSIKKQRINAHMLRQAKLVLTLEARSKQLHKLSEKGFVSLTQIEQHNIQLLTLTQSRLDSQLQLKQINEQQQELATQIEISKVNLEKLKVDRNLVLIASNEKRQQLIEKQQYIIRAAQAGKIDNLQVEQGDSIGFAQELMQLRPVENDFTIRLAAQAHQVTNISPQQTVKVIVDGFAYQKFGFIKAKVLRISNAVVLPKDIKRAAITIQQPVYLLELKLAEQAASEYLDTIELKAGMTVSANVQTHHQSILDWLIEPIAKLFNNKGI